MKFSYTALTADNKKMTGVLDAESLAAAQSELHKMGVAIITVGGITEEEYEKLKKVQEEARVAKGIQSFTFIAVDPNNKEIEGTIDSADDYSAYKRLRTEYKFKINELYLSTATDAERLTAKKVLEGFEARLESDLEKEKTERGEEGEEGGEKISRELVAEIDLVIINTKTLMESHRNLFSMDMQREITEALGELERIRTSNNVKHITEVSNTLYELISNPDKSEGEVADAEYKSILNKLQESALVKKEFDLYKKAIEATGAKKVFKNIVERLKNLTAPKEETPKKPVGALGKAKNKLHKLLEKFTEKKVTKRKKPKSSFGIFLGTLIDYFKATSPVLKKTRKKELAKAFKSMFKKSIKAGEEIEAEAEAEAEAKKEAVKKETPVEEKIKKGKWDFTDLFLETDSFLCWLLCFYIIYFYLVNFSLEKNIGLSRDFILKTIKTPLILNITIFLLIAHYVLRMRNMHFRHNFFASLFLIFLCLGVYTLLIVNF